MFRVIDIWTPTDYFSSKLPGGIRYHETVQYDMHPKWLPAIDIGPRGIDLAMVSSYITLVMEKNVSLLLSEAQN